jgi:hypothetical protein
MHLRVVDGIDRAEHQVVRNDEKKIGALTTRDVLERPGRTRLRRGKGDR